MSLKVEVWQWVKQLGISKIWNAIKYRGNGYGIVSGIPNQGQLLANHSTKNTNIIDSKVELV